MINQQWINIILFALVIFLLFNLWQNDREDFHIVTSDDNGNLLRFDDKNNVIKYTVNGREFPLFEILGENKIKMNGDVTINGNLEANKLTALDDFLPKKNIWLTGDLSVGGKLTVENNSLHKGDIQMFKPEGKIIFGTNPNSLYINTILGQDGQDNSSHFVVRRTHDNCGVFLSRGDGQVFYNAQNTIPPNWACGQ